MENVAEALDNVTRDAEELNSEDIKNVATTLQSIVDVESASLEVSTHIGIIIVV